LLTKAHRDHAFTTNLSGQIERVIKAYFKQSLYFSLNIEYSQAYYTTNIHLADGDLLQAFENQPVNYHLIE
jgi:hypothetical protein